MNSIQILKRLKELWPGLKHIWPWDQKYEPIEMDELKEVSEIIRKVKITFPNGTELQFEDLQNEYEDYWDCDDIACGAEFLTKLWFKLQADQSGDRIARPYGRVKGVQFRGIFGPHDLNIALGQEKIFLNDHDAGGRSWEANGELDLPFFVSV